MFLDSTRLRELSPSLHHRSSQAHPSARSAANGVPHLCHLPIHHCHQQFRLPSRPYSHALLSYTHSSSARRQTTSASHSKPPPTMNTVKRTNHDEAEKESSSNIDGVTSSRPSGQFPSPHEQNYQRGIFQWRPLPLLCRGCRYICCNPFVVKECNYRICSGQIC